jgi:hypothetical protein
MGRPDRVHWTGDRFVVCTLPTAPKVRALTARPGVALALDTNTWSPKVLLVQGEASLETVDGIPREYVEASKN